LEYDLQTSRLTDQDNVRLVPAHSIKRVGQPRGGSNVVQIVAGSKNSLQPFENDWLRFTGEYRETVQYIPLKELKIDGDSMRV
jgi:hypothetical protein